ncbi:MAG: hypothetical protein JWO05_2001 [Gemmatimonadetes bacterium]|nr:hypothetical protein [Gemmatimonadota bacterium]
MTSPRYEPSSDRARAAADDRAVLTLAVGKPLYRDFAITLARSFRYWNPTTRFVIATDDPEGVPEDVRRVGIEVHPIPPGKYGEGFSPKLHLDRLAPASRTLFIDADCLVVGSVDSIFERFAGHAVSVVGGTIDRGEWFGNVASVCAKAGVPALPKFNGGIYYLERGPRCTAVYEEARALEPRYDALGLERLRGRPNDELLMAIAMALHGEGGIAEDGTIMAEPLNFGSGLSVDVLRGRATLHNTPGHENYKPSWPLAIAHPLIVHFLGYHTDRAPYTTEAHRLRKVMVDGWAPWAATLVASAIHEVPQATSDRVKELLRPVYRALFGVRAVPVSNRI